MRKLSPFIIAVLFLVCSISSTFAQTQQTQPLSDKERLHDAYVLSKLIDPNKAYQYANEYLQKFGSDNDERTKSMRMFIIRHDYAPMQVEVQKALAAKDHAKVVALGRQIISKDSENLAVLFQVVGSGYQLIEAGDKSLTPEMIDYAKRALKFLEPANERNIPGNVKPEEARGIFNYQLGLLLHTASPEEAVTAFRLAALSSAYRNTRDVYLFLGTNLQLVYVKLIDELKKRLETEGRTDSVLALDTERKRYANKIVDAYARFVALSTKPEQEDSKAKMMGTLTKLYKIFNNQSDAGLNELINTVLTKPLP